MDAVVFTDEDEFVAEMGKKPDDGYDLLSVGGFSIMKSDVAIDG